MLEGLWRDLRFGARSLMRARGTSVAAIVTLGLGIGAASAIFSVVDATLLTPLPYAEPERRVLIWSRWTGFEKTWVSDQEIVDYRTFAKTMTAVAGWDYFWQNLTGDGEPLRVGVGAVTANLFEVLGATPMLGRPFTADEDRPNGPAVAVLGHTLWQTHFGGDATIVGRKILLDDVPTEVVGVMPPGFRLPTDFTENAAEPTELWLPLRMDESQLSRGSHAYFAAALLAPGQTAASASDELGAIMRRLAERGEYETADRFTAFAVPIDEEIRGGIRPALWLLIGAVAFLLLIACVNVANLLLVRGDARVREMAVRTAVGAAPSRLARQLFAEGLVLALLGGLLGLGLAFVGLLVLMALDPTSLPPLATVSLDSRVVVFTLALAVVTTLLFSLAPALRTRQIQLVESLREGGQQSTVGGRRRRLRGLLVAAEVALAVVLVVGAGLMIRSLAAITRVDLGFEPQGVLTMRLALPPARYDTPEEVVGFYRQLLERVRSLPRVEQAGVVRVLPLATTIGDWGLDVAGYVEGPGQYAKGDWQVVSDGAFEAMGMRLVRGRWLQPSDTSATQPVAVVNETMAKTYWAEGDAIGGRIRLGSAADDRPWASVVGIVADERHNGVTGLVREKFYVPHSQFHRVTATPGEEEFLIPDMFLVARTDGEPLALTALVRREIRALDPSLPVANVRPMTEVVATALATPRLTGFLLGVFAAIALALAAVGIYGVVAYTVSQRTHEIGIRLAMGADRARVLRMILLQGVMLATAGVVLGVLGASLLTRWMRSLLYQVEPGDPLTFALVVVSILLVATLASALPALRATRVSPVRALRTE